MLFQKPTPHNQTIFSTRDPGKMGIFALLLEHKTFYIGTTKLKQFSLEDVLRHSIPPMARHWLSLHAPIKVFCVYFNAHPFDEDKWVKAYMYHYGVENVRGGSYQTVILDPLLRRLLAHEIAYVESQVKPQSTANMSQSLLSSRLGDMNQSLTNSVLAESTLLNGMYNINGGGDEKNKGNVEEQTITESIYEMAYTAYDMMWELSKYVWPWKATETVIPSKSL